MTRRRTKNSVRFCAHIFNIKENCLFRIFYQEFLAELDSFNLICLVIDTRVPSVHKYVLLIYVKLKVRWRLLIKYNACFIVTMNRNQYYNVYIY